MPSSPATARFPVPSLTARVPVRSLTTRSLTTRALTALALAGLLTAAGCASQGPGADPNGEEAVGVPEEGADTDQAGGGLVAEEEEEVVEWVFEAGEQITVELTMYSEADGGRSTPVFSGYRPTVEFDHLGQSLTCAVQLPSDASPFEPGDTHLVGLECVDSVTVHVDEPGFVLVEGGKENGGGEVVLTEM